MAEIWGWGGGGKDGVWSGLRGSEQMGVEKTTDVSTGYKEHSHGDYSAFLWQQRDWYSVIRESSHSKINESNTNKNSLACTLRSTLEISGYGPDRLWRQGLCSILPKCHLNSKHCFNEHLWGDYKLILKVLVAPSKKDGSPWGTATATPQSPLLVRRGLVTDIRAAAQSRQSHC